MATVLLYGDTIRYPAIRREVPLEIVDPLLFVEHDGTPRVLTSSLEAHEPPWLGIGGVRFEDLLLITEDGAETLTSYPYDL